MRLRFRSACAGLLGCEDEGAGFGEGGDGMLFGGGGFAAFVVVGAESSKDESCGRFDGHAPGADEAERGGEVTEFGPFIVGVEVGRENSAAGCGGGGAGAEVWIWPNAIDRREVVSGKVWRSAVSEQPLFIEDENGNDGARPRHDLTSGGQSRQDFVACGAGAEHRLDVFARVIDELVIDRRPRSRADEGRRDHFIIQDIHAIQVQRVILASS